MSHTGFVRGSHGLTCADIARRLGDSIHIFDARMAPAEWREQASELGLLRDTVKASRLCVVLEYLAERADRAFTVAHLRQALDPRAPAASYRRDLQQFAKQKNSWLCAEVSSDDLSTKYRLVEPLVTEAQPFLRFLRTLLDEPGVDNSQDNQESKMSVSQDESSPFSQQATYLEETLPRIKAQKAELKAALSKQEETAQHLKATRATKRTEELNVKKLTEREAKLREQLQSTQQGLQQSQARLETFTQQVETLNTAYQEATTAVTNHRQQVKALQKKLVDATRPLKQAMDSSMDLDDEEEPAQSVVDSPAKFETHQVVLKAEEEEASVRWVPALVVAVRQHTDGTHVYDVMMSETNLGSETEHNLRPHNLDALSSPQIQQVLGTLKKNEKKATQVVKKRPGQLPQLKPLDLVVDGTKKTGFVLFTRKTPEGHHVCHTFGIKKTSSRYSRVYTGCKQTSQCQRLTQQPQLQQAQETLVALLQQEENHWREVPVSSSASKSSQAATSPQKRKLETAADQGSVSKKSRSSAAGSKNKTRK